MGNPKSESTSAENPKPEIRSADARHSLPSDFGTTRISSFPTFLVIGYGNSLRRDDGLGPAIARLIEARQFPGVHTLTPHQLTPELAETISQAEAVVFIDASVDGMRSVQLRKLEPEPAPSLRTHHGDPGALLALAATLYGKRPAAWTLTVPAFDLEFGEGLSPEGQAMTGPAVELFARLLAERLPNGSAEGPPQVCYW